MLGLRLADGRRREGERGSAAIEAAIGATAFVLFIAMIIAGGRIAMAYQAVEAAASEAARSASIARTQGEAEARPVGATASLANQHVRASRSSVSVDTSGFAALGTPARVTATVSCVVDLSDVAIPGCPAPAPSPRPCPAPSTPTGSTDMWRPQRSPTGAARERGSVSVWFATASFVMILLVGLAVDLTGQVHAQQRTRDVAAQAARAGGQELTARRCPRSRRAGRRHPAAVQAAQTYLASTGHRHGHRRRR